MVVTTRSDTTALEHILGVLLEEPTVSPSDTYVPNFRACFNEAGVTCASDFISIEPSIYGDIPFSNVKRGTEKDTNLNVVQTKKLSSLVSWFRQPPSSPAVHWFDLSEDTFRTWRTDSAITPSPPVPALTTTPTTAISAIMDFRKGVKRSISDYKPFKEDRYFNS
jgi:hypothetical protein